jgi:outer membrane protein assembly factor BamB
MSARIVIGAAVLSLVLVAQVAIAQCPPSCPVKGGGDATTDCHSELASETIRLNAPYFNPAKPKPAKEIRCFDGEAGCDLDNTANNACVFDIDVCLRNADPDLPTCTATDVTAFDVKGSTTKYPGLAGLQSGVDALLPASGNVCTVGQSVTVPLKGPTSKGEFKAAKFSFKTVATVTGGATDSDGVKLVCVPRGWPSHGYDGDNTRATPLDVGIDSSNVTSVVEKWNFAVLGGKSVTSTITVGPKLVYATAWDGRVYALDKKNGAVKWDFNTGSSLQLGVQSSATLTADGRLLVGDSLGKVYCLDAKKGTLLWTADTSTDDPEASHIWASPTVANNRVLIGRASHNDSPCTRGTLFAYDLDTGAELWRQHTIPERICYDDTSVACSDNADCAAPGSPCLLGHCDSNPDIACGDDNDCPSIFLDAGRCVVGECWLERSIACASDADCPACAPAKGGGITATAAVSADGEDVYMASVGCLSFPSVGSSDSIFKLDAATGAIDWTYRSRTPEQFESFPGSPGYQDYGFLNGPILADVDDGLGGTTAVAVGGGKDGTLYAVDQTTGALVWSNELAPPPAFAAFGLFNGAPGYDAETDRFFAALFDVATYPAGNDRLVAFDGEAGAVAWSDQIGSSWSSVTIANDLVFAGTQSTSELYVYDKITGVRLHTITLPGGTVTGGAALENGVLYIPYGDIFGGPGAVGGVLAMAVPVP